MSRYGINIKTASAILFGAITAVYFLTITSEPNLGPDSNPDSTTYLVLAKSLASGQGYRNIDLVCNTPNSHFPPVFPVLLMPFIRLSGLNILVLKGMVTFLALISFFCLGLPLFRFKPGHTLPVLLLTMTSPYIFKFSHLIMSEIPYLLFSLLVIYFVSRYKDQNGWLNRHGFMAVFFLVLACFTRSIGIGLLAATVCALLFGNNRWSATLKFKKALFIIIGFGISAITFRLLIHGGFHATGGSYFNELFIDPYDPSGMMNASNLFSRLAHNAYALFFYGFPNILTGIQFKGRTIIGVIMTGFMIWGFTSAFKRNWSIVEWYMACYLLILLIWPWTRHHGTRFLIPVIPFVFYHFLNGADRVANQIPAKRVGKATFAILLALLIGSNSLFTYRFIKTECERDWSQKPSGRYIEMADWLRKSTSPDAEVITWSTQTLYLWGRRKCVCLPEFHTAEDLKNAIIENRGSYLVSDRANDPVLFQTAVSSSAESLTELYNKNNLKIYKVE